MDASTACVDGLLRSAAPRLTGDPRRLVLAEVATELCDGRPGPAERRFGGGRATVAKGLHETRQGIRGLEDFAARGRPRREAKDPQLAADIGAIVEPHPPADPELQSARRYTKLSAAEVRDALIAQGDTEEELPSDRTMRDILNRMNYRLQRIQNGEPLKQTKATAAILAHIKPVRDQPRSDRETWEISLDTTAEVGWGDYARGGKNPDRRPR